MTDIKITLTAENFKKKGQSTEVSGEFSFKLTPAQIALINNGDPEPAVPSGFPFNLSGMVLGVDPSTSPSASQWNDGSGNGRHLVAGSVQPVASSLNGQTVLSFAAATDKMKTVGNVGLSGNPAFTAVAVVKSFAVAPGYYGFGGFGDSGEALKAAGGIWPSDAGNKLLYAFAGANSFKTDDSLSADTKIVVVTKAPGSIAGNTKARVNATNLGDAGGSSSEVPNIADTPLVLNCWSSLADTPWVGQIGAYFLFNRVLTASEIENMETYLNGLFAAY